jgi:putative two-component system response regulator
VSACNAQARGFRQIGRSIMSKLLIVDDDARAREFLEGVLTGAQYELIFAKSGEEALLLASEAQPDLMILDGMLPGIDGFEVCRHLRLDPLLDDMPIIMVTGLDDHASRVRGLEAGADDVIAKPFDPIELRALVRTITNLNRYHRRMDERIKHQREQVRHDLAFDATLEAWASALELRGVEPAGHIRRILPLCLKLAREMKIPEADMSRLRTGVLLHDIGLMGLPDAILLKTRSLAASEEVALRMHPEYARNMLAAVEALQFSLEIPYCHHENWDGSGYPRGLKGEEIPLLARLFSVVDAWDELGADRPRAKALPPAQVLAFIREKSGTLFDPQVVQAFERVLQADPAFASAMTAASVLSRRAPFLQKNHLWAGSFSLASQGTRSHFAAAIALITILPVLALAYLAFSGVLPVQYQSTTFISCGCVILAMMILGYGLLANYPANIGRLRQQLEMLARGVLPLRVDLYKDENDLVAIEKSMRDIVLQVGERIRTIEMQSEALLVAERQRVAIEGLGAACHHLGQPASTIRMALYLVRQAKTPDEREDLLRQCEESADAIADTLEKLQHIANYRTEPYLPNAANTKSKEEQRILEIAVK